MGCVFVSYLEIYSVIFPNLTRMYHEDERPLYRIKNDFLRPMRLCPYDEVIKHNIILDTQTYAGVENPTLLLKIFNHIRI